MLRMLPKIAKNTRRAMVVRTFQLFKFLAFSLVALSQVDTKLAPTESSIDTKNSCCVFETPFPAVARTLLSCQVNEYLVDIAEGTRQEHVVENSVKFKT